MQRLLTHLSRPVRFLAVVGVACAYLPLAGCSGMIADQMLRPKSDPRRVAALMAGRREVEKRWAGQWHDFSYAAPDGKPMRAMVLAPRLAPDARPRGVVVLLHGLTDRKEGMLPYAEAFAEHEYVAVCADLRAHGQSGGRYTTFGRRERWDLSALLDALGRRGYDCSRVGVMGHSLGAATALQWAGVDDRVKAVVAVAPFSELRAEAEFQYSLQNPPLSPVKIAIVEAAVQEAARFRIDEVSPLAAVESIRTPIYFVRGDRDAVIPAGQCDQLFEASKGPSVIDRVPNAGHHDATTVLGGVFLRRATEWMDRFLSPGASLDPLPMWMTGLNHKNMGIEVESPG